MEGDVRYQVALGDEINEQATADLATIEIAEKVRGETTFTVRFAIDVCATEVELLKDPRLTPGNDRTMSILVTVNGEETCLAHGIITGRKADLKQGGPGSSLEVTGQDRRVVLGRNGNAQTSHTGKLSSIVGQLLSSADFEIDVEVADEPVYSADTRPLNQQGSDLDLIKKMAGEIGVEFWVDCTASNKPGGKVKVTETAHFRSSPPRNEGPKLGGFSPPLPLSPKGPPKLTLNSGDAKSTMLSFSSERNSEHPNTSGSVASVSATSGDVENTRVDGPSQPRLGEAPPSPMHTQAVIGAGDVEDDRRRQQAALNDAAWSIKANAETTVYALGGLIRPHDVVQVEGAGELDDGDYFVWSVTHNIDPADHKMKCELRRNAVGGA